MPRLVVLCLCFLLVGCAQVYTDQPFPDVNEIPKRPKLKSTKEYKKEAQEAADEDNDTEEVEIEEEVEIFTQKKKLPPCKGKRPKITKPYATLF